MIKAIPLGRVGWPQHMTHRTWPRASDRAGKEKPPEDVHGLKTLSAMMSILGCFGLGFGLVLFFPV